MPAPTVLAVHADAPEPPVAATTILHPAMARARRNGPHWPPRRWAYIAGAGAIFLLMLLGSYLFDRPHQGGSSPDAGMAGATSPSVASPGNDPAAASAEPVSSAPKENSALEVVEQARQPKKVDTLAAARNEPASAAKPPASSAGRTGEWQVTENRTRKIH